MLQECPKCRGFYATEPYEGMSGDRVCKCAIKHDAEASRDYVQRMVSVVASKQTVSDACRMNHGWLKAGQIAVERLQLAYMDLQASWPLGKGARFIFTLTVEYTDHTNTSNSPAPSRSTEP